MKPPVWTFFDGNCLQRKRIFLSVYTLVDVCPTLLSVPPLYHNIYVVSWEIWQVDKCSPNVWIEDWRGPSFYVNTLLLNMNTICQDQHAQLKLSQCLKNNFYPQCIRLCLGGRGWGPPPLMVIYNVILIYWNCIYLTLAQTVFGLTDIQILDNS